MNKTENDIFISSIFSNYRIPSDDFTYIYRGALSIAISNSLLDLTERNFKKQQINSAMFKKVYFILVEILQNVTKYQQEVKEYSKNSIVIVQRLNSIYYLTVGNLIKNAEIDFLKEKIDKINSLDKEQLNKYYKQVLINGKFNDKGGAGLGLINIKRRSNQKLNYSFSALNEELSYFYFNSIITPSETEEVFFTFKNVKNAHKIFKKDKISLLFSNVFDQDKIKGLLQIVQENLHEKLSTRKKVFNVMVEVLQNIVYHTVGVGDDGKFGIFLISETSDFYKLRAGNFIANSELSVFTKKLEEVNHFSEAELEKAYLDELKSPVKSNNSNLGIIDIRLRSSNFLNYEFQKISDDESFFTIEVNINK